LSRFMGTLANLKQPKWLITLAIRAFMRRYHVNMQEALAPNVKDYATFNAFFTRKLRPDARSIDHDPSAIISPADGAISEIGQIHHDKIIQAKNHSYQLLSLLGNKTELTDLFLNGSFATIYLAPKDYHRVHMPVSGELKQMLYIPGKLFSVNQRTANYVPGLFARNERLVAIFETSIGKMAVILVGAMIVASIVTSWSGLVIPSIKKQVQAWEYDAIFLDKGQELGYFQLGSTVILLFQPNQVEWQSSLAQGQQVQFGQAIAKFRR
jgi:phosphatidylserine decarboxylase